jgi:hypothetical protein
MVIPQPKISMNLFLYLIWKLLSRPVVCAHFQGLEANNFSQLAESIKATVRTNIRKDVVRTGVCVHIAVCVHTSVRYTVELSKTKLGTLPPDQHKANWAFCHDEVRFLIFDDPAENERGQRPPREGKLSNPRGAHRAGCMHGENSRNPARGRRAAAMRQFLSDQLDNTVCVYTAITARSACVHRCTSTVLNLVMCLCL